MSGKKVRRLTYDCWHGSWVRRKNSAGNTRMPDWLSSLGADCPDFDFNAGDVPVRIRVWGGVRGNRVIVSLLSKVHLDVAAGRKKEIRTPVIRLPSIEKLIRIGGPDRSVHPVDASIGKLGLPAFLGKVRFRAAHGAEQAEASSVLEILEFIPCFAVKGSKPERFAVGGKGGGVMTLPLLHRGETLEEFRIPASQIESAAVLSFGLWSFAILSEQIPQELPCLPVLRIVVKQTMQHSLRFSAPSRVQELGCVTQTIFRTQIGRASCRERV